MQLKFNVFLFTVIPFIVMTLLHFCTCHNRTVITSWAKFAAISSLKSGSQQNEFPLNLNYNWTCVGEKCTNMALCSIAVANGFLDYLSIIMLATILRHKSPVRCHLTHWGRNKMDAILQTTFWSAFSWIKMFEFWIRFHWSLFLRVLLTIIQHWFR